jgi:hypothetical protein
MDVFFIDPEPLVLVLNRLMAHCAVPIHHVHCIGVAGVAHHEGTRLQAPTQVELDLRQNSKRTPAEIRDSHGPNP